MSRALALSVLAATSMAAAVLTANAASAAEPVTLPGLRYEVLHSGPAGGPHPTRADAVTMRYTGRLTDGTVFSASPDGGDAAFNFEVKGVIPGMSAALQLMRPGDVWRMTLPSYLAYGALGRHYTPAEPLLKHDIPPDSTLIFVVELVSVVPPATKTP